MMVLQTSPTRQGFSASTICPARFTSQPAPFADEVPAQPTWQCRRRPCWTGRSWLTCANSTSKSVRTATPIANWTHCHPVRSPTRSSNPRKCWRMPWGAKCQALHTHSVSIARETRRVVQSLGCSSACAGMNAFSSSLDCVFSLARLTIRATTTTDELEAWLGGQGARVAPYPETLRTTAWRLYRRARRGRAALGTVNTTERTSCPSELAARI